MLTSRDFESDVEVCKNVNDVLIKQVASVERECWRNDNRHA